MTVKFANNTTIRHEIVLPQVTPISDSNDVQVEGVRFTLVYGSQHYRQRAARDLAVAEYIDEQDKKKHEFNNRRRLLTQSLVLKGYPRDSVHQAVEILIPLED